ncbi:NAD(P)/FAD-dependent oxidoreductase [Nocardia sp. NPDC050697]|uniref:FAD-dependent oxidoreductase n=1 Tax=Nocardia sp. NPDC050697 TaxID=3155158 RepID=UPI0033D871B6
MRAVVIGAGVGGACAALALTEIGVTVQIYEASERSADVSGWVTLGPSASTVLDQLGVGAEVRRRGFPVTRVTTTDTVSGRQHSFERFEETHRWPSTHVWRRDLLSVLRTRLAEVGVTSCFGSRVDPADVAADLLVGADGARSMTRRALGDHRDPTFAGQLICYGHSEHVLGELPEGVLHFWSRPDGVAGYAGHRGHGSFWFSRGDAESAQSATGQPELLAALADLPIAKLVESSRVSRPVALYELEPSGIWHTTTTVLIGDAAHAVSPAAGRGASSAIEDAVFLARAIRDSPTVEAGLQAYDRIRRPVAMHTYRPTPGLRVPRVSAAELRW